MGGCFSANSSSKFNKIRLVHLSGYVEDFEQPISVNQVTGNSPKHFVCTSIQLLSSSPYNLLKGDTQLQPGNVYFMLPYSILQGDASPMDLASLAKRLTTIAKTRCSDDKKSLKGGPLSSQNELCSIWSSPSSSPGRFGVVEQIGLAYGGRSPCRVQPWKPILDTIREKSFNRRSESDLQENC